MEKIESIYFYRLWTPELIKYCNTIFQLFYSQRTEWGTPASNGTISCISARWIKRQFLCMLKQFGSYVKVTLGESDINRVKHTARDPGRNNRVSVPRD